MSLLKTGGAHARAPPGCTALAAVDNKGVDFDRRLFDLERSGLHAAPPRVIRAANRAVRSSTDGNGRPCPGLTLRTS